LLRRQHKLRQQHKKTTFCTPVCVAFHAAGQSVPRSQNVLGVTFSFQPPPKSIVPCAASLKQLYAPPHSVAK
jgi:hypothetical protein